ncbi:MAG: phosphotransferase [Candidatus Diapherotrites archaeon]
MNEYNCDLHFHGLYSGGVSKNMHPPIIAEQAGLKGLHVVSTSDALHGKWFKELETELVEEENGVLKHKKFDTYFITGVEVEDANRIHQLIFLPDLSTALNLKESLKGTANFECFGCGRPRIKLSAEQLAEKVFDAGGIIGPAHAFTPYFSVYAHFDSVKKAFGEMAGKISFIELGLSADSYFADLIEENHNYGFLTASDSHSPWPFRIGREFMRIKMKKPSFGELKKALEQKEEKLITLNVGLDPREGKYHATACNGCFEKFSMEQAVQLKWRCPKCRGQIKRGVRDRISELASFTKETHPPFRPPYLHLLPLAEIIQSALGIKNVQAQRVQSAWRDFVSRFKTEIAVQVDAPENELLEVNESIGKKIIAFRKGWTLYIPGGGGDYGKPIVCDSEEEFQRKKKEMKDELDGKGSFAGQKTLKEF